MMRPSSDVADKAVSTEDLQYGCIAAKDGDGVRGAVTNTASELVRLEAVLTALVENKVIAIKAAADKTKKSAVLRPRSLSSGNQGKLQRLTSTSTASSSHQESLQHPAHPQQQHHHHHHHHHHQHRRKRQSDSALLSSGLLFPTRRYRGHHHIRAHDCDGDHRKGGCGGGGGGGGGGGEHMPPRCAECRECVPHEEASAAAHHEDGDLRTKSATDLAETEFCGAESGRRYSLTESTSHAGPSTSCYSSPLHVGYHTYAYNPAACRSPPADTPPCCASPTNSQSKILVSPFETDHVSLNMATEEDEEEAAKRRKRKRRRRKRLQQENSEHGRTKRQHRIDPEDLPKRARWTIIATAFLLLLMSVLLVGVTLRMAPIIDEIVRKENEQLINSLGREEDNLFNATGTTSSREASTHATTAD